MEGSEGGIKGIGEWRENGQVRSVRLRELGKGFTKRITLKTKEEGRAGGQKGGRRGLGGMVEGRLGKKERGGGSESVGWK